MEHHVEHFHGEGIACIGYQQFDTAAGVTQLDANRAAGRAVFVCIHYEVRQRFANAPGIEHSAYRRRGVEIDAGSRHRRLQQFKLFTARIREVDVLLPELETDPHLRTVEYQQVVEQLAHAFPAADEALRGHCHRRVDRGSRNQLGRHQDGTEGAAQVVAEHAQENVAPPFHLAGIVTHRFGDGLVDRLVEPRHLVEGSRLSIGSAAHRRNTDARRARYSATRFEML